MSSRETPPVSELERLVTKRRDEFVDVLRGMVNVDCGSYTPEGVNAIADLCQSRFEKAGWEVERRQHRPGEGEQRLGDLVVGRVEGRGRTRVLMIGHTDTVFDPGTSAERPFRFEGERALGPGVTDMKGGLLTGFFAVETLLAAGFDGFDRITYVNNPDEEIGSPWSREVILSEAADADVALVLEAARENGDIVSSRKGVLDVRLEITGRAAHAGVEPERGRNAILEAAHKTVAIQALNGRWPGVTANVGVVSGGTRPNVVPERCVIGFDVRSPHEDTFELAGQAVREIAETHAVPDVSVQMISHGWHRPMEKKEGGARLAALAIQVASELGFELRDTSTGGASDANTTSGAGVPSLDGLGPIGGDDHGPSEWLDLSSVVPRISLLAGIVSRLDSH